MLRCDRVRGDSCQEHSEDQHAAAGRIHASCRDLRPVGKQVECVVGGKGEGRWWLVRQVVYSSVKTVFRHSVHFCQLNVFFFLFFFSSISASVEV